MEPEQITPEDLARWKALCEAATPGLWTTDLDAFVFGPNHSVLFQTFGKTEDDFENASDNRAFVVSARTALPALLAAYERVVEERTLLCKVLTLQDGEDLVEAAQDAVENHQLAVSTTAHLEAELATARSDHQRIRGDYERECGKLTARVAKVEGERNALWIVEETNRYLRQRIKELEFTI
jgi:hypothetical protein